MNINTKNIQIFAIAAAMTITAMAPAKSMINETPIHLAKADAIVNSLRSQGLAGQFNAANGSPLNHYGASWANAFAVWGPTATVDAQCSSFVTLVLKNSYPGWTGQAAGFGTASPTAAMYHDAIEAETNGFTKVDEFEDIEPGDFLMAKYYDDSTNTGHAMIVKEAQAVAVDLNTGVITWAVQVIDCSKSGHSSDTRDFTVNNKPYATNGAGRGIMRVDTLNGDIIGYAWSFSNGSTYYTPSVRHLTLGHLGN